MNEHILTENPNRFVLFPLKYNDIWELYKTAEHSFWTAEEIDLAQDLTDWNEKLNTEFQNRVKTNGNTSNLTFRPTIRNVIGVIMASVDAFYRLMDDVHNNAWNQRNNPKRIQSIIQKGSPSQEGKNSVESTSKNNLSNVVYPWPQFVQKKENSGTAEYQITYPGSKSVVNFTKGYDTTIWPEVDFVEQFLYGVTVKDLDYNNDSQNSPTLALNYTPSSAIEFAFKDQIYSNKDLTWDERMKNLMEYFGKSERTVRKWLVALGIKQLKQDPWKTVETDYPVESLVKGTVTKPNGTAAIASTPNNLFGKTRNKLNVGKKYHSAKMSNGVLKGSAGSPN